MENFCYWQESSPTGSLNEIYSKFFGKICLFRYNEYKLDQEVNGNSKINIFCPYKTKEEAQECKEYMVSRVSYGK